MRLAISNIAWPKSQDELIYRHMQEYGFTGLEIAPTRIFEKEPYAHMEEASVFSNNLWQNYGFKIISMQSIWYGRSEMLFGSERERQILIDYTRSAIDFAAKVGAHNLVFGSPKNRFRGSSSESIAIDFFAELGEYAADKGTILAIEANPAIYHTDFINTTSEAFELVERINSKGVGVNLDLGTMIENKEDISIIQDRISWINHIHISEPFLNKIEHRLQHKQLKDILKENGYDKWISIEMKRMDITADVVDTIRYVSEVFS